ncbi:restriction endonuclease subunit S [Photobacterium damselae]|uniref:restriction endonuclease subunit S n=1 Tax=Photobacterium damselae TaxID=38293 RepID=UPI003B67EE3C
MTKQLNVPILRFSEFLDVWESKNLGQVLTIGSGRDYKHLDNGNVPVFGTGGYMSSVDTPLHTGESVFIGRKGSIDKPFYYEGDFWTVDTLFYTKNFVGVTPKFTYNLFQRINWKLYNEATGVPSLSKATIQKIRVNLPTLPEQQKIASFLSKVDEKIGLLTEKKDKLAEYKKGVMQQLFNGKWEKQDGQLTFIPPTLRFKADDGSDFPDWEEVSLGDVLIPTFREVDKPSNNYLAIGVRSHCKGTFQKPDSEPDKVAMDKLYVVRAGDLIVNITFAWEGAIAIVKDEDDGGYVSHRFPTYLFDEDRLLGSFFESLFKQKRFRFDLDLISPGGAGRNRVLSKKEFLKLTVSVPSINEQKKISEGLTLVQQKLDLANSELEKAKEWKKGLLQQMFV